MQAGNVISAYTDSSKPSVNKLNQGSNIPTTQSSSNREFTSTPQIVYSTGSYSSSGGGSSRGFTYNIYSNNRGEITGGSAGTITFSSGFARLFYSVIGSSKK